MLGSPGSHGLAGTRPRCSRSLLSFKAASSFFPVEPLMLGSLGSRGLAGTRPAISQKPPLTARDAARGGFEGTAANLYCLANFKRKAFSPQILNRSCLQIRCTVTGGAYHSARRVSPCVRNGYKTGASLNCTRSTHQTVPQRPFSPSSFPARRKRRGRRRLVGNGLDGTSLRCSRSLFSCLVQEKKRKIMSIIIDIRKLLC